MCQCAFVGRATLVKVQPADLRLSDKQRRPAAAMRAKTRCHALLLTGIMKSPAARCISASATLACRPGSHSTDSIEAVLRRLQV